MAFIQANLGSMGGGSGQLSSPGATGSPVGRGNCIVGATFGSSPTDGSSLLASVTDDKGNSYQIGTGSGSGGGGADKWLVPFTLFNITNGPSTLTATYNSPGVAWPQLVWAEYSLQGAGIVAGHNATYYYGPGTGTDAISSGSMATSTGPVVGFCINSSAYSTVAAGTGFTTRLHDTTGVDWGFIIEDLVGSGTNRAVTFTDATNGANGSNAVVVVGLAIQPNLADLRSRPPISHPRHRRRGTIRTQFPGHLYPYVHPFLALEEFVSSKTRAQLATSRKRRRAWHVQPKHLYPAVDPGIPLYYQGVDFRQTLGFVTDPTNYDYALWGPTPTYPQVTRQGWTVGFTTTSTIVAANNESTSNDPRLAGNVYVPSQFLQLEGGGFIQLEGGGFISLEGH